MADLQEIRKEIDRIDKEIVRLFEERMECCKNVAESKIETGKQVFDKEREQQKIEAVKALTHNELNAMGAGELFGQIMSISRKLQYRLMAEHGMVEKNSFTKVEDLNRKTAKVVYQGIEGSYSYAAMHTYFGKEVDNFHVDTFRLPWRLLQDRKQTMQYCLLKIPQQALSVKSMIYWWNLIIILWESRLLR